MTKKNEILSIACYLFCISLFVLALNIPLVYYSFQDEDSTCVQGERGGIDLPLWGKLVGLEKCVLTGFLYICLLLSAFGADFMMYGASVALIVDVFWHIMFWIWGVVIIATNENNLCVKEGKGMAVTCIIWLVTGEIGFAYQTTLSKLVG